MNKTSCLVNLRPMWSKYFTSSNYKNSIDEVEKQLLNSLSSIVNHNSHIQFTFVPFNTDSFGMSDIDAAHRLQELVNGNNFDIMYKELHCSDIVSYISQFNMAICMRLHACVFCWSQNVPTFGIEYADKPGKVAAFCNRHNSGKWTIATEINEQHLTRFLNENSPSP